MERPKKLRALIVDDSPITRRIMRALLSTAGIDVVAEAQSGEEAVRLSSVHRPDLLTLDVVLPGMDGIATARLIRKELPEARILMCSSALTKYKVDECKAFGVGDFLLKPMDKDSFANFLSKVKGVAA
jgi:two-component system chemotaxis response regulator CheY